MKRLILYILISLTVIPSFAEGQFRFRVWFSDKTGTPYSIESPNDFLTEKSIQRRLNQQIGLDERDLPVNPEYIRTITGLGTKEITRSRWMNTVVVSTADSIVALQIEKLPFVKKVDWVWKTPEKTKEGISYEGKFFKKQKNGSDYGDALFQIAIHNGDKLHAAGFTGKGITIAVIDVGFMNVDQNPLFDLHKIAGSRNFVSPDTDPFIAGNHGALVLSAMAGNRQGTFIGTAPDADYWLLCSEDEKSELPIEEDYWVTAAEFADSVGVDVINSSLGYSIYDIKELSYKQSDLDGKTAFITRAAAIGAEKGMLIVNSAGNDREKEWGKILFPADAENILTVGGIDRELNPSTFSSPGYTADLRVKPDVVSIGTKTTLVGLDGTILQSDGTSFATPIITGLAACLWQALPHLSAREILRLIRENSSQYNNPDVRKGYGIPDIYAAYRQAVSKLENSKSDKPLIYFDPQGDGMILLRNIPANGQTYNVSVYTAQGVKKAGFRLRDENQVISTRNLPAGLYIIQIQGYGISLNTKFIKP